MGQGQKTKTGRVVQMIQHGADPNLFNPNGKRTVCSNFDEYDYSEAREVEKLKRQGAKALIGNVPLEEMWTLTAKGKLFYNLVEEQILLHWLGEPFGSTTVAGATETEYRRAQFERAERRFFSIQEGTLTDCELGGYGMWTAFKWQSKRGNKGNAVFELNGVTQAAVPFGAMTGATLQNTKVRVVGAAASGNVTIQISPNGGPAFSFVIVPGDTAATIKTKAQDAAIAAGHTGALVDVLGSLASPNEVQTLAIAAGYGGGPVTVTNGGVTRTFTPGDSLASIGQKWGELLGLPNGAVVATGTSAAPVAGSEVAPTGGTAFSNCTFFNGPLSNIFDQNTGTRATILSIDSSVVADAVIGYLYPSQQTFGGINMSFYSVGGERIYAYVVEVSNDTTNGLNGTWTTVYSYNGAGLASSHNASFVAATAKAIRVRFVSNAGNTVGEFNEIDFLSSATAGGLNVNLTFSGAGAAGINHAQPTTTTPGVTIGTTANGGSGVNGQTDIELKGVLANKSALASKTSGGAGYTVSITQYGSDGNVLATAVSPKPIMPGHIECFMATTLAGLDGVGAKVLKLAEWELGDSKIVSPQSHHVKLDDPARPNLPTTYDSHAEEESEEDGLMLTLTLDCDETGEVPALLNSARGYISEPRWFRIVATCPELPYRVIVEFYGSIGASVPRKFAGNVEQRTFPIDLIELPGAPFNFRVLSRRPA